MWSSMARITTAAAMHQVSTDPASAVRAAVKLLQAGQVIAVPTDTVYGLATSAEDTAAIERLYKIKGRDEKKPLAVCVSKVSEIENFSQSAHLPKGLLETLLPGPVTVVLKRSNNLGEFLNPGNPLVAIRVPDDKFIQEVCEKFQQPIALTSANVSSEPSSLKISEFQQLWPQLGGVFDGGTLAGSRKASTIVDLSHPHFYSIIRDGSALRSTVLCMEHFGLKPKTLWS